MSSTALRRKLLVLLVAGASLVGAQQAIGLKRQASNTKADAAAAKIGASVADALKSQESLAAAVPESDTPANGPKTVQEEVAIRIAMREEWEQRLEEERRLEEQRRAEEERRQKEAERERMLASSRGEGRSFMDLPLTTPSGVTAEQLDRAFAGTGMAGLGAAFEQAEAEWGVNAIGLAAIAIHESGWGNSRYARERNNLFGMGAITSNPDNAKWYETKTDSVMHAAEHLKKNYLTEGGRYYRGGTPRQIGVIYADGSEMWAVKVTNTMALLMRKIGG